MIKSNDIIDNNKEDSVPTEIIVDGQKIVFGTKEWIEFIENQKPLHSSNL